MFYHCLKEPKKETFNIFIQLFNFSSSCVSCNIIFSVLFGFNIPYFTHTQTHIHEHIVFGKFSHQEPKQKRSLILYLLIILSGIFFCVWFFVSLRFLFYMFQQEHMVSEGWWYRLLLIFVYLGLCITSEGKENGREKNLTKKEKPFFVIFMGTKICYIFLNFFFMFCVWSRFYSS